MANKAKIEGEIGLNVAPWVRSTTFIRKSAAETATVIKHEFEGIKDALLAGIGIGAITEMVGSAIEFARELRRSSDELGVSIDRAAQLKDIMESLGKDSSALVTYMNHFQRYMGEAREDIEKMDLLKSLGITEYDFQHFNFDEILKKALKSTEKMAGAEANLKFNIAFGKGAGTTLLPKKTQLLETPEETGIREQELREIEETVAAFKKLKDAISTFIMELLQPVTKKISAYDAESKDFEETVRKKMQVGEVEFQKKHGNDQEAWSKLVNREMDELERLEKTKIFGPASLFLKKQMESGVLSRMFGGDKDIIEAMKKVPRVTKNMEERDKANKTKTPTDQGEVPTIGGKQLGQISSNNPFVAIGGLMGTDISYRIERLQQQSNNLLKQIADNTSVLKGNKENINSPTLGPFPDLGGAYTTGESSLSPVFPGPSK